MTSADAVRRSRDAIARSNDAVRAWAWLVSDAALAASLASDALPDAALPLQGVTVGVKDIIDVAGMPTVAGFAPYAARGPATRDAVVVERLRAAGGIMLGKTVTTQFALSDPPVTRNPWNVARTPGGSSSGSAAAVAAGHVDLAIGSQTTGSTLRPAAYCGVYALKPRFNWISRAGMLPLSHSLDHVGLIAANLDVLERGFLAVAREQRDAETTAQLRETPLRIAVWREPLALVDRAIRTCFEEAVARIAAAGAVVSNLPVFMPYQRIFAVQQVVFGCEAAAVHRALLARNPDDYAPRVRSVVEVGSAVPAHMYVRAQALRGELRAAALRFWSQFDAVLLPTAGSTAPDASTTGDTTLQAAATLFGLPALSLPAGLAEDGMPWGLQLIAPSMDSTQRLLAVGRWVDAVLPKLPAPPISAVAPLASN